MQVSSHGREAAYLSILGVFCWHTQEVCMLHMHTGRSHTGHAGAHAGSTLGILVKSRDLTLVAHESCKQTFVRAPLSYTGAMQLANKGCAAR